LAGPGRDLYRIDVNTKQATFINTSNNIPVLDLAWYDGALYGVAGSPPTLYKYDVDTVRLSSVRNSGGPTGCAGMFGAPNVLFGASNFGGFYKIGPKTGIALEISGSPSSADNDGAKCYSSRIEFPADLAVKKTSSDGAY